MSVTGAATDLTVTRSARRTVLWAMAGTYIAGNYLALESAPAVWREIDGALRGRGEMAMFALYALTAIAAMVYVARSRGRSPWTHLATLGLLGVFFAMYSVERGAAEKFHMFQYGLFGVLLFFALRVDMNPRGTRL